MFLKTLHIEQNTRKYFLVLFNKISFLTAELQLSCMKGNLSTVPCTTRKSVLTFTAWPLDCYRKRPQYHGIGRWVGSKIGLHIWRKISYPCQISTDSMFIQPVHQSLHQMNYPSWQEHNFIYRKHADYSTVMVTGCITLQSTVTFLFRLQIYVCNFLYFFTVYVRNLQWGKDKDWEYSETGGLRELLNLEG